MAVACQLFNYDDDLNMPSNGEQWRGAKVLVTGADGFIGSHLTEALVELGADVTALALYNSFDSHGWLDVLDPAVRAKIRLVRGDIRDPHQMIELARGQRTIFHLAALISIPYSYDAPASFVATNVSGTVNILSAARAAEVERIVCTSTSEVYGTAQFTPITEDHPLQGQSPYSASKIAADMMAESFARSFDTPVVILRPFNTFGPRQSERAVIPTVIRQVLDTKCGEIRLGDLRPYRAFSYVSDTVHAFLAAASGGADMIGKVYNAGVNRMVTIGDLAEMIRMIAGSNKPVIQEDVRRRPPASEVMALIADSSRLQAAVGWQPRVELETGIATTLDWWRGHIARARPDSSYVV